MKLKTFSLLVNEDGVLDDREMQAELEDCEVLKVWEQFLEVERGMAHHGWVPSPERRGD